VGKRVGEWVYELFITMLDAEGFLVQDVLDLYHGRGADRGRCSPMKISRKISIAGVPTPNVGKSCGKLRESAVWNLRLSLGQRMQGVQVREIEWAPPKETPAVFGASEPSPQEYGPWQWATAFGRATGRFGAEDARVAREREAALPSRGQSVVERSARVRMPLRKPAVYLAYQTDCQLCPLREQCLAKGGQRGSSPSR
jgi:hypothetical protein